VKKLKIMLEDSNALFEVLQELGAKKPYLEYAGLSKSGEKSYHKLVNIIYSLEKIGFFFLRDSNTAHPAINTTNIPAYSPEPECLS